MPLILHRGHHRRGRRRGGHIFTIAGHRRGKGGLVGSAISDTWGFIGRPTVSGGVTANRGDIGAIRRVQGVSRRKRSAVVIVGDGAAAGRHGGRGRGVDSGLATTDSGCLCDLVARGDIANIRAVRGQRVVVFLVIHRGQR